MTTDAILYTVLGVRPLTAARAGTAANRATASHVFSAYQQRRPANTLRRQRADLDRFVTFLRAVGAGPAGQFAKELSTWAGVTWGLVVAFVPQNRSTIPMGEVERLLRAYEEIIEENTNGLAASA